MAIMWKYSQPFDANNNFRIKSSQAFVVFLHLPLPLRFSFVFFFFLFYGFFLLFFLLRFMLLCSVRFTILRKKKLLVLCHIVWIIQIYLWANLILKCITTNVTATIYTKRHVILWGLTTIKCLFELYNFVFMRIRKKKTLIRVTRSLHWCYAVQRSN